HGILRSTRGVDGGYTLTRSPEEISLLELIEAIEGPLDSNGEPMFEGIPTWSRNRLQGALREVTATTRRQLESVKLSALLAETTAEQPV
ncbi:MAG TPA: Rrf2 family transcriptional regulator, partial [Pirellulaceae bacterium]|nr:Rrf2 family transcriptional regulator [Pirellulaceae bacterium]